MKTAVVLFGVLISTITWAEETIPYFFTDEISINQTLSLLSMVSDTKVVASKDVKLKKISLKLKDTTSLEVLEGLCRDAEICYYYDPVSTMYTLMTVDDYQRHLFETAQDTIRYFNVRPANLNRIAENIATLFGERVILNYDKEITKMTVNTSSVLSEGSDIGDDVLSSKESAPTVKTRELVNPDKSKLFGISFSTELVIKLENAKRKNGYKSTPSVIQQFLTKYRKEKPTIHVMTNTEHSMVSIRTTDNTILPEIEKTIKQFNRPLKQVLLEMKILELTIGDDFQSQFNFSYQDENSNNEHDLNLGASTAQLPSSSLNYLFVNNHVEASLEMIKANNELEVLATPMVIATNNRQAELKLVENNQFVKGATYEDPQFDSNGNVTVPAKLKIDISEEQVGLTLRILPRINDDRSVLLEIYQESSDKLPDAGKIPFTDINGVVTDYPIDLKKEKTVTSTVMAKDGLTVAIGGLVQTKNQIDYNKVPFLGDLPLLGFLFRDEVTKNVKTELVLLITPHILEDAAESESSSKELINHLSNHNYLTDGQEGVDSKVKQLREYNNPPLNSIQEIIREPDLTTDLFRDSSTSKESDND